MGHFRRREVYPLAALMRLEKRGQMVGATDKLNVIRSTAHIWTVSHRSYISLNGTAYTTTARPPSLLQRKSTSVPHLRRVACGR
jgi:hypothetical protein